MGWLAIVAGIAFGLALALLVTFLVTGDERFDRVAEWCFVVFALAAIPTMMSVAGRIDEGPVALAATLTGIAGVAILGLGEVASGLKLVDFRRIAPLVTLGFLAYLIWIGVVSVLILMQGGLPVGLGWLGVLTIAVGAVLLLWIVRMPGVMSGDATPGRPQMAAFMVPMAGIVLWMVWLGLSL